jgi:hypothetical protein
MMKISGRYVQSEAHELQLWGEITLERGSKYGHH